MAPLYIVVPQDKIVHEYTVRIAVQVVVVLEEWWSALVRVRGLQKYSCLGTILCLHYLSGTNLIGMLGEYL